MWWWQMYNLIKITIHGQEIIIYIIFIVYENANSVSILRKRNWSTICLYAIWSGLIAVVIGNH